MSFARYWRRICDEYVKGGRFDEIYDRIRNRIDELVETDPNALYNYEEYTVAAELLYETINLRAESINGQLNGTIPSTDAGQRQDSSHLIDASHTDVTLMGQFNMGGFGSATLSGTSKLMTLIVYGLCLLFMLALLIR